MGRICPEGVTVRALRAFNVYGYFLALFLPQFTSPRSMGWFAVALTICFSLKIHPAKLTSPGIDTLGFSRLFFPEKTHLVGPLRAFLDLLLALLQRLAV